MSDSHPYYEGIKTALVSATTEPSAATLSNCQIYADQLPKDPELPGIRLALLIDNPSHRLASENNTTANVQIDVYTHRADEARAWAIDRAVRSVLSRSVITVEGFGRVVVMVNQRGTPFKEEGYYRIRSTYQLYGNAA